MKREGGELRAAGNGRQGTLQGRGTGGGGVGSGGWTTPPLLRARGRNVGRVRKGTVLRRSLVGCVAPLGQHTTSQMGCKFAYALCKHKRKVRSVEPETVLEEEEVKLVRPASGFVRDIVTPVTPASDIVFACTEHDPSSSLPRSSWRSEPRSGPLKARALFACYGAGVLAVSAFRRMQGNRQFFSEIGDDGLSRKRFRTSGNVVIVLTSLSVAAYVCLLILTLRLDT
nr:hypothetical protein CFP56_28629 [Quercus suber]